MFRHNGARSAIAFMVIALAACSAAATPSPAATAAITLAPGPTATAAVTPTPTLDPTSQAYFDLIKTDGTAYMGANNALLDHCPGDCTAAMISGPATSLTKLQVDLATVQPPAQWSAADRSIRLSLAPAISALQAMAKAYGAGQGSAYVAAQATYVSVAGPLQLALVTIDPDLRFG